MSTSHEFWVLNKTVYNKTPCTIEEIENTNQIHVMSQNSSTIEFYYFSCRDLCVYTKYVIAQFPFCKMKRDVEKDGGDRCTTMWTYLMHWTTHL